MTPLAEGHSLRRLLRTLTVKRGKASTIHTVPAKNALSLYEPLKAVKEKQWVLPPNLRNFIEQHFSLWVDETMVKKDLLEANPPPAHNKIRTLKLEMW